MILDWNRKHHVSIKVVLFMYVFCEVDVLKRYAYEGLSRSSGQT